MPKVFISYTHDSPAHRDRILDLSDRLRSDGLDCSIDQYEQFPAEGWPRWCANQVEESDFVLVVCTKIYLRRFKGQDAPNVGLGGTWEGHIITQELYDAEGRNTKFIPILLSKEDRPFVPTPLRSAPRYQIPDGYDNLYRLLTAQPLIPKPALGSIKPMPARERKQDFQSVWRLPHSRNPFFTGREQILASLRAALEQWKSVALSGFGGVGKTQTAIEYAYRFRSRYKAVLWANAETRDTLLGDFVSIARKLDLPSSEAGEQKLAIAEVRDWLQANPGWLLVLDNADDLALAKDFLPNSHDGHVVLTTRARALAGLAERLIISAMQPEEGALLLLRRANLPGEADQSLALQISHELGGLPLALDQAGAFVEETPCTLSDYLAIYGSEEHKLLAERGSLGDHPSVAVTFSLAFEKVAGNSAASADLIRLCAFLAPDAIPEEIVIRGADVLGEHLGPAAHSPFDFAKAIQEAGRFSLLTRDAQNKTLDIHRLVQAVVQSGMPVADQRLWAERAVRAVAKAFPSTEFENWRLCQILLPHAQACAILIDKWGLAFEDAATLLGMASLYLYNRWLFTEAAPLCRRALEIDEKTLGPDHANVAGTLNNLAEIYRRQGQFVKAEPLYRRALAIYETSLGPDHPGTAASLNNLANLYYNQRQFAEAEPLFHRALALNEKIFGPNDPNVAMSLGNLASIYREQGKYAEAEPLYRHALAIYEASLETDPSGLAACLNNLANLYYDQRRYDDAEPLYQRAVATQEKAMGTDHPLVAMSLDNLAILYRAQGRHAEAEPLRQRALAIREKPR